MSQMNKSIPFLVFSLAANCLFAGICPTGTTLCGTDLSCLTEDQRLNEQLILCDTGSTSQSRTLQPLDTSNPYDEESLAWQLARLVSEHWNEFGHRFLDTRTRYPGQAVYRLFTEYPDEFGTGSEWNKAMQDEVYIHVLGMVDVIKVEDTPFGEPHLSPPRDIDVQILTRWLQGWVDFDLSRYIEPVNFFVSIKPTKLETRLEKQIARSVRELKKSLALSVRVGIHPRVTLNQIVLESSVDALGESTLLQCTSSGSGEKSWQ